jgi:hypothetical protein
MEIGSSQCSSNTLWRRYWDIHWRNVLAASSSQSPLTQAQVQEEQQALDRYYESLDREDHDG